MAKLSTKEIQEMFESLPKEIKEKFIKEVEKTYKEIDLVTIIGTSCGGLIKAHLLQGSVKKLEISNSLMKPEFVSVVEEGVLLAVKNLFNQYDKTLMSAMQKIVDAYLEEFDKKTFTGQDTKNDKLDPDVNRHTPDDESLN